MVKALPAGQFTVVDTVTVLNKLRTWHQMATDRYGLQFRWIMMVGDISAMYDEIDPKIACDALRQALSTVQVWTDRRGARCKGVNMAYNGGDAKWGMPNADRRVYMDLKILLELVEFDCLNTLYKFCGQVNCRKFGVPMGGFMSPHMAVLTLAMFELEMEEPSGLVGGIVRYMDDVFGIYAVQTEEEERTVQDWFKVVGASYPPPLQLNVEEESNTVRFLELVIKTAGPQLSCSLFNKVADDLLSGQPVRQRLVGFGGGTSMMAKRAVVVGAIHRALDGSLTPSDLLVSVVRILLEMGIAGWPMKWIVRAIDVALRKEHVMGDALWATKRVIQSALGL